MERVVPGPSTCIPLQKRLWLWTSCLHLHKWPFSSLPTCSPPSALLICLSHPAVLNTSKRYSCNLPNPASPEATKLQVKPQQAPRSGLQYDTQLPHSS